MFAGICCTMLHNVMCFMACSMWLCILVSWLNLLYFCQLKVISGKFDWQIAICQCTAMKRCTFNFINTFTTSGWKQLVKLGPLQKSEDLPPNLCRELFWEVRSHFFKCCLYKLLSGLQIVIIIKKFLW